MAPLTKNGCQLFFIAKAHHFPVYRTQQTRGAPKHVGCVYTLPFKHPPPTTTVTHCFTTRSFSFSRVWASGPHTYIYNRFFAYKTSKKDRTKPPQRNQLYIGACIHATPFSLVGRAARTFFGVVVLAHQQKRFFFSRYCMRVYLII